MAGLLCAIHQPNFLPRLSTLLAVALTSARAGGSGHREGPPSSAPRVSLSQRQTPADNRPRTGDSPSPPAGGQGGYPPILPSRCTSSAQLERATGQPGPKLPETGPLGNQ